MELWEAKVSTYTKTQRGKKTLQSEIRLLRGHPFNKDDNVIVARVEDIKELQEELETLREANRGISLEANNTLKVLNNVKDVVVRQKEVIGTYKTLLGIYMARGLWSRLTNPVPKEVKTLESQEDKLAVLEDNKPTIIDVLLPAGKEEDRGE